jgi:NhaA family Na+:H+ antiporter
MSTSEGAAVDPSPGSPTVETAYQSALRVLQPLDRTRDHLRGSGAEARAIEVIGYQDFLCPYCRRLRSIFARLRNALGDRLVYAFRHFPNERAHPGATLAARAAEAAARQNRFWEMHDRLFDREPPFARADLVSFARELGLDVEQFERDLDDDGVAARVQSDFNGARRNGVTGTPTLFVDGVRYDGAWDFHSMLEGLERPLAARMQRSARVFASLPTSAGLVLLIAALLALLCANTPLRGIYAALMNAPLGVGPLQNLLSMPIREWLSEGLLTFFFLLVGIEIRREMTVGALADRRAAILPAVAALGGVIVPALIYRAFNPGPAAQGWSVPTATDIAFTLGILAVLGTRVPMGLRVLVAALAVADDILSVLTLAIFYARDFQPIFLLAAAGAVVALIVLNRVRVYALWPYAALSVVLWLSLHTAGVDAALSGAILALCLPARPRPAVTPLLAQAASALAELEISERDARRDGQSDWRPEGEPVWDWAARNLSAASDRLLSPADRVERAIAPWSAFFILPLFAFSATGISIDLQLSSPQSWRIFAGVLLALVIGKPLGVLTTSALAIAARAAVVPEGVALRQFIGGACLCGVSDTVALLMADRALPAADAAVAKVAVLIGSALAGLLGALVLRRRARTTTEREAASLGG